MFNYVWPIALVILSNVAYQICAKSMPSNMNPMASLAVTYCVGAVISAVLFFALNRGESIIKELGKINWAPFVFGIVLVGLEVGWIYAYRAGWQVSTAQIVQSAFPGRGAYLRGNPALQRDAELEQNRRRRNMPCGACVY